MSSLQDDQPSFDRAVCDAMVISTPETWGTIVLELRRPNGSTQLGDFEHSITNPDGLAPVMPDDSLYTATYNLDELFQRHGAVFCRAVYRVELSADSWRYVATFEYDHPA